MMNHAQAATYFRTALLLGLVRGDVVQQWATAVIEREPSPPPAFFDLVSVAPDDLSELRHALWPLVTEPPPAGVLQALLGRLHQQLASGGRSLADTLTVLRQMRSMLRLPADLYADLNAAMVAHAAAADRGATLTVWLSQFAQARIDFEAPADG